MDIDPSKKFRPLRDCLNFFVDWQRTTGQILASFDRTREAGLAKIADAEERERMYKTVDLGERE